MYVRVYLLGPAWWYPRAIVFRFGRNSRDHVTHGFSPFGRQKHVRWRTKHWEG